MPPKPFFKSNGKTAWASKLRVEFLLSSWKNVYKYQHLRDIIFVSFQDFQLCKIVSFLHSQALQRVTVESQRHLMSHQCSRWRTQYRVRDSRITKKFKLEVTSGGFLFQPPFELHRPLRKLLSCQFLGTKGFSAAIGRHHFAYIYTHTWIIFWTILVILQIFKKAKPQPLSFKS